jgi:hypothetical protein
MIDKGYIKGFRLVSSPTKKLRERRVLHSSLVAFIKEYPDYKFMLDRLDGYDATKDFEEGFYRRWPATCRPPTAHPRRVKGKQRIEEVVDASALVSDPDQ